MSELERKDVPDEILEKVLKFANTHKTFLTKELFNAYPNNQEFLLRYALNNLRIDKKLCMYGAKRGSYYSTDFNLKNEVDEIGAIHNTDNSSLKQRILETASKQQGWFSRPALGIEDVSIPTLLEAIRELIEEGKLQSQGERRWTQYALPNVAKNITEEIKTNENTYELILDFIKKHKVVTIPILINELEIQRTDIIPILNKLCEEEEIWHEGIKKSSKYIYKDINLDEMDKYLAKLNEERKLDQRIDELSQFLINDNACSMIVGANKNGDFEIKFMDSANVIKQIQYESINDCIKSIKKMTEQQ